MKGSWPFWPWCSTAVQLLQDAAQTIRLDPPGRLGHESGPSDGSQSSRESSQHELGGTGTDGKQNKIKQFATLAQW